MAAKAKPDNRTHVQRRHAESAEAMRAYLAARGFLQQIEKDLGREIDADELPVVKFKTETRLRLLSKILPDVQSVQLSGADGGTIQTQIIVGFREPAV